MKTSPTPKQKDTTQMQERLRLKQACITSFQILTNEELPEKRRIELAIEHLRIIQ